MCRVRRSDQDQIIAAYPIDSGCRRLRVGTEDRHDIRVAGIERDILDWQAVAGKVRQPAEACAGLSTEGTIRDRISAIALGLIVEREGIRVDSLAVDEHGAGDIAQVMGGAAEADRVVAAA